MWLSKYEPFFKYQEIYFNHDLSDKLEAATISLATDLKRIGTLFQDTYLSGALKDIEGVLTRDAYIIGCTLSRCQKPLQDAVLVEYGGGCGLHSLLARKLGIGTVIYNDILPAFCTLAREIAEAVSCQADYYVEGDIDDLVNLFDRHQLKADAITSSDVLEHIYDIDDFLRKLHLISYEGTTMMHCTNANMFWYPHLKAVSKQHIKVETKSAEEEDHLSAYHTERMKIISEYAQNLDEDVVNQLSINTRGLVQHDIVKAVDQYLETGELPKLIEHPTNTCNPYTGSWAERSMNPYYLREKLELNGFEAKVLPGPWQGRHKLIANILRSTLNLLMRMLGPNMGLYFSCYYSIYAKYNGKFSEEIHKEHMYKFRGSPIWFIVLLPYEVISLFRPRRSFYQPSNL